MSSPGYLARLVLPVTLYEQTGGRAAGYFYQADAPAAYGDLQASLSGVKSSMLWLLGSHEGVSRPLEDMLAFPGFRKMLAGKGGVPLRKNHTLRLYGEFLALELMHLGFSVLSLPAETEAGRPVIGDDAEENAELIAAFWSGLRINGIALSLRVNAVASDGVDWRHAGYAIAAGIPFVEVPASLAAGKARQFLFVDAGFNGVGCVSSLADAHGQHPSLCETAKALLDAGWTCLLLNGLSDTDALDIANALEQEDVGDTDAHRDGIRRLEKRRGQLLALDTRGSGFVQLDRDIMYQDKRKLLAKRFGIDDPHGGSLCLRAGSVVCFHYMLRDAAGNELEHSGKEGVRAFVGGRQMLAGLSRAMLGHVVGDSFEVVIPPEEGYGLYDKSLRLRAPADAIMLQPGEKLMPGARASAMRGPGGAMHGVITAIDGNEVEIDANHPLAGMELHFEVRISEIV